MKRIALIACVKQKLPHKARAEDLYTSDLFRKHLEYAKQRSPDAIYILSARYGLLPLDAEIEPYDQTLKTMSASQVRAWAQRVVEQLAQCADLRNDHFIILAGEAYYNTDCVCFGQRPSPGRERPGSFCKALRAVFSPRRGLC